MRDDLLISFWILIWFIMYIVGVLPFNPSFALILATIVIIIAACRVIYKQAPMYNVIKFIIISGMIKVGPLLILYYKNDVNISMNDLYFGLLLFIAYNIHLFMNNTNVVDVYTFMADVYIYSKPHEHNTFVSKTYDNLVRLINGESNIT